MSPTAMAISSELFCWLLKITKIIAVLNQTPKNAGTENKLTVPETSKA